MKTMICRELGGACEKSFKAETFEEMSELVKQHGVEMFMAGDEPHLSAIRKMQQMIQTPEEMSKWFAEKKKQFDALPNE